MNKYYVRQSLALHLFFARIMKEHAFFLQVGFTPKDNRYMNQADTFRQEFDQLLKDVVLASDGVVGRDVLSSGEVFTPYTMNAEEVSSRYTGVLIPTDITNAEMNLMPRNDSAMSEDVEQTVNEINHRAMKLIAAFIKFKTDVLNNVMSCNMFTVNYPHLIDHIIREAKMYLEMVQQLQNSVKSDNMQNGVKTENMQDSENLQDMQDSENSQEMQNGEQQDDMQDELKHEMFWNNIMAEHSEFIRGLLDPTEKELFKTADNFANEFDMLTEEAKQAMDNKVDDGKVTIDSMDCTKKIRDFKTQGTQGILECKVKSIILPLLADHTLREANHYLRLLEDYMH